MVNAAASQGRLRPVIAADLESLLALRNHPKIRRYMLSQHEIAIEEHALWFDRVSQGTDIELLLFELDAKCCGFVQYKKTNFPGVVDWGFYAAPDAPKGTGRKLGLAALNHAFTKRECYKICGQALHWNQPSIAFHESLGFVQEGSLRDQHFDGAEYHSLVCFGLLKRDYIINESLTGTRK
jgi:UDP-4-amino-4,6-dideoxy-N-acetyl-beta-L-altrosamine N-acetyltransferase